MRRALLAMALAAQAPAAWYSRQGDVFLLGGSAELEWLTPSAFRFRRAVEGRLPVLNREPHAVVEVQAAERPNAIELRTKYLQVEVAARTLRVRVTTVEGEVLAEDRGDVVRTGGTLAWERLARPGVRYYGLGPRTDAQLDARGRRLRATVPFLLTSAGYAEYHAAPGAYTFDLTRGNRVEIGGGALIDYYFAYGPGPKEIYQELCDARVTVAEPPATAAEGSWEGLRGAVASLAHASLSGLLMPKFEVGGGPARARARQIEEYVRQGGRPELNPLFDAYLREAEWRGLPLVRPLAMQYSGDAMASDCSDEFMLGDELLLAPIVTPGEERSVYLPMGMWTLLESNEVFRGRQTVRVRSRGIPAFSRNGAILPFQRKVRELHYFPRLGGEFFFYESDANDWTQVHAAPAADIIRLEIESKVDREYEWVVHHTGRPASAGFGGEHFAEVDDPAALARGKWFYDAARRNVHVRLLARAGEDRIVNLSF